MIEFLHGILAAKSPARVTVQIAGIGLEALVPLSTYEALPREGEEVRLLTHLHLRDDALSLYAFASEQERELFRMLLGVSQVGPMVALRVLSSIRPADFKRYILDEDADALKDMVKGIGAKTARRLIAELQGAVQELSVEAAEPLGDAALRDAVQALVALGESRASAERAVRAAVQKLGAEADCQRLVEEALGH
jgi:Holliday junction DNA helicase RuvA